MEARCGFDGQGVVSYDVGAVGWWVRVVFAVQRDWWTSSRPIIFLTRVGRSSSCLRLSSNGRRATEQAEGTDSEGWVESGRKTPCILKRARWGGVEYLHERRYESIIRVEKPSAGPRSLVDRGPRGPWESGVLD